MGDEPVNLDRFNQIADASLSAPTLRIYQNKLKRIARDLIDEDDNDTRIEDLPMAKILKFIEEESVHADGKSKTASTPEGYRNALVYYYKKNNIELPHEIDVQLAKFVKGVRNLYAAGRRDGTHKSAEGKDVLDFQSYETICLASMKDKYTDGHLYMQLMWNMASRSDSAESLNYQSISWSDDCVTIKIEKSKTLQAGAQRGPVHHFRVYSNPLQPALCLFLAMGIKLACTSQLLPNAALYRANEYKHFADWLDEHFAQVPEDQHNRDFGSQSIRKGSLTYALSFPGAVSAISAILRAGYTLGGVLPKYVDLILRGDENVGRVLCGLNPQSAEFSLLPPRFGSTAGIRWNEVVADFHLYPESFRECIPYFVASVVHHRRWLMDNLPSEHPLFLSRLWRGNFHESLASRVLPPVHMECPTTGMRASGVTALTVVLKAMNDLQSSFSAVAIAAPAPAPPPPPDSAASNEVSNQLIAMVSGLAEAFNEFRREVRSNQAATSSATAPATAQEPSAPPLRLNQAVTASFVWPMEPTLRQMHELWHGGIPSDKVPPLSTIKASTLKATGSNKRFVTDAKACMYAIDSYLPANYHKLAQETQDDVFRSACKLLCEEMVQKGHPSTVETLGKALLHNNYRSVYSNDLIYIREYNKKNNL